MLRAGRSGS